jgi:VIT1/CCC1 family predicted Fe2+/Mn2+ transporter
VLTRLYVCRGVPHDSARETAEAVMREPDTALSVHAQEELGVRPDTLVNPWRVALTSFLAFAVGAVLPVLPWFAGSGTAPTVASVAIGVVAAATVGVLIGRFAERSVAASALRQVFILLGACGVTYALGKAIGVNVS